MAEKLNDEQVEEMLTEYLKKEALPFEMLLRAAIPWAQLDVLQGEQVLKSLCSRGLVEFNGGWYRLLSENEKEERKPKGIAGLFRKK
jgi:hypothetical protein